MIGVEYRFKKSGAPKELFNLFGLITKFINRKNRFFKLL